MGGLHEWYNKSRDEFIVRTAYSNNHPLADRKPEILG
jgi:hypothetical protein